ncbi:MAG: M24 family metallopeptidase [Bacteroidia bacterium]|nr:M24 family metallopeptidase [Bacteroidia bacterium]
MLRTCLPILLTLCAFAAEAQTPLILTQREQAVVVDGIFEDRMRTVLPALMRREGVDMWVIISREYNEDPVIRTMLPAVWFAARRTTMLVISDPGNGKELECLAVSRYPVGKVFERAWDPESQPDQWAQLARLIEERNPKKIAVNKAENYGHADGLTANDYDKLLKALNKKFQSHIVSGERLAVGWLETRSEKEMVIYQQVCRVAHDIIQEGFSDNVIHPGITTTDDVVWWYRERIRELKLDTWFHPSVSIQRNEPDVIFAKRIQPVAIMPGDLLHVDFGITYLRLNTDTQQHAYVLKAGETDAPEYLKKAFARGNRLQDILTGNFREGKTGNQILSESRKQAVDGGLTPSIYTHPIGYHGHAAGTTIGMWDMQGGVPNTGDYPLHYRTAYSIELNVTVYLIEWKKEIQIKLEEDGYFDETGFRYIDGRQTELILIPKPSRINR